jgi:hypothetical protein
VAAKRPQTAARLKKKAAGSRVLTQAAGSPFKTKTAEDGSGVEITNYKGNDAKVIIPAKIRGKPVTVIGSGAFSRNRLAGLTIKNGVKKIEGEAFSFNRLTAIAIPKSVTFIGVLAFANNQITGVTIPRSLKWLGTCAFAENPVTEINVCERVNINCAFQNGFETAYAKNHAYAGIYTREDTDGDGWTKAKRKSKPARA